LAGLVHGPMQANGNEGVRAPAPRADAGRGGNVLGGTTERKLQRMGAVTVGVSLPREWVGQRGLSVGSTVRLTARSDGSLVLLDRSPVPEVRRAMLTVDRRATSEHLFRDLIGAYLTGASEFDLRVPGGLTPEVRSTVRTFVRRTIQPEIVSEDHDRVLLRDVSLGTFLPVPSLIRRMFQVVRDLQIDAGRCWTASDTRRQPLLETRDDEVDRYAWLVERVLALHGWAGVPEREHDGRGEDPLGDLLVARYLERIGDHAVRIEEHGLRLRDAGVAGTVSDALTDYHEQVVQHLKDAFEAAQRGDIDRANDVIDTGQALHAEHDALSENLLYQAGPSRVPPAAHASLSLLLESMDRTTAYAQDIGEVGLDRGAARGVLRQPRLPAPTITALTPAARSTRPIGKPA
jgi:phosphate uptake regulator